MRRDDQNFQKEQANYDDDILRVAYYVEGIIY